MKTKETKTNDELAGEFLTFPAHQEFIRIERDSMLIEIKVTRELAAAMAMQGLLTRKFFQDEVVEEAVELADKLLRHLDKTK